MRTAVRVRFAPSPTGPLHIGGLRTALYNYLFARQNGGAFVLRIEDTDRSRFVSGTEAYIQKALTWCGLEPDESPDKDGGYGPYRQSERGAVYKKHIHALVEKGWAYYAFDSAESLDKHRKDHESKGKTFVYNWHNRLKLQNSLSLSADEVEKRRNEGVNYVVRFKMLDPENESDDYVVNDEIRGKIKTDLRLLDDKILFKSDGMPTYHFANVVDDHLMRISHVIRGEEWLPSLPLHCRLYDAFGWEPPVFAHLPLILKPSGKGKLSKRDGEKLGFPVFPIEWKETGTSGYREQGYLPAAMTNFLALLGWNPGTEEEVFELGDLIKSFDLGRVHKAGARFDPEKNMWFNQQHIQKMPLSRWTKHCEEVLIEKGVSYDKNRLITASESIQSRVVLTRDIWEEIKVFFEAPLQYEEKSVKKAWKDHTPLVLESVCVAFARSWQDDAEAIKSKLVEVAKQHALGLGGVMAPLRVCLVGSLKGPDLMVLAKQLGSEEVIKRIRAALACLQE
ncbi:MAG: glutamate--tRNA ligase [Flavobacteriaceae bacterium]